MNRIISVLRSQNTVPPEDNAATAYPSGLLALYWADKYSTKTPDEFIAAILGECDTVKIGSSYNQSEYGEGYLYYH
jgi:hypothetical protein